VQREKKNKERKTFILEITLKIIVVILKPLVKVRGLLANNMCKEKEKK
jgi:hypothetical protein